MSRHLFHTPTPMPSSLLRPSSPILQLPQAVIAANYDRVVECWLMWSIIYQGLGQDNPPSCCRNAHFAKDEEECLSSGRYMYYGNPSENKKKRSLVQAFVLPWRTHTYVFFKQGSLPFPPLMTYTFSPVPTPHVQILFAVCSESFSHRRASLNEALHVCSLFSACILLYY